MTDPTTPNHLDPALLASFSASNGRTLAEITADASTLIVFLRHFGCTFCMEAAADIAKQRDAIEQLGTGIVFVHMSRNANAEAFFQRYGMPDALHISDPQCRLYDAFDLKRGTLGQLFGPKVFARGINAFLTGGHAVGKLQGDGFQMPGVFLMRGNAILAGFRHAHAGERPDYLRLAGGDASAKTG
jgi:peroxiredoxin